MPPATGLTCVGYGWALLSIIASCCTTAGFYLPYWLMGEIKVKDEYSEASFGSFRRCNYPAKSVESHHLILIKGCARYSTLDDIPSLYWQISTFCVAAGVCLSLLIGMIAVPSCCMRDVISRTTALLMGIGQVLAALAVGTGCILYPLGWDNREVREACGQNSGQYLLGACTIGWSIYLMVGGAVLLLLCASLSTKAGHPIWWKQIEGHASNHLATSSIDEQSLLHSIAHSNNAKILNVS